MPNMFVLMCGNASPSCNWQKCSTSPQKANTWKTIGGNANVCSCSVAIIALRSMPFGNIRFVRPLGIRQSLSHLHSPPDTSGPQELRHVALLAWHRLSPHSVPRIAQRDAIELLLGLPRSPGKCGVISAEGARKHDEVGGQAGRHRRPTCLLTPAS